MIKKIKKALDEDKYLPGNDEIKNLSTRAKAFLFHLRMIEPQGLNEGTIVDYDEWEKIMGKKRATIERCIKELDEKGFLDRYYLPFPGINKRISNKLYIRLNLKVED